ncbi:hypothetical protein Bca4012_004636 [Brassica carinata]
MVTFKLFAHRVPGLVSVEILRRKQVGLFFTCFHSLRSNLKKTKLYDPTLDDQYKLYFLAPRSERSHSLAPRLDGICSHSAWSRPSKKSPRN